MTSIFLTGERHAGKSTLLGKVLEQVGFRYRGVVTEAYPKTGRDKVIRMSEAAGHGPGIVCGQVKDGRKICYDAVFDTVGVGFLQADGGERLVVIDEIGSMEADAEEYSRAVLALLDRSDVMVFGVIQNDCTTPLGMRIRACPAVELVHVTEGNRDGLVMLLAERVRASLNGGLG